MDRIRHTAGGRYGVRANHGGTYLATFRAVSKKYPHKAVGEVLADLVKTTPGDEGKWFAAAKDAGPYDEALDLASRTPCDPKTLTCAARGYAEKQPARTERFHQGIGGQRIRKHVGPTNDNGADGKVACRSRLGGMLNDYYREAA